MSKGMTSLGGRSNEWLTVVNKKGCDSQGLESQPYNFQTTARFSKPVFKELERRSTENNSSIAEEIRKLVRKGIRHDSEGGGE